MNFPTQITSARIGLLTLLLAAVAAMAPAAVPAESLSPEIQRLVGTWLAPTHCGREGRRGPRLQQILLTVRPDAAGGVSAEVRGMEHTAGIALDVAFDGALQLYRFTYAGWLPAGGGSQKQPYGLELMFVEGRELLHGEVTGRTDCETVVAGRLPGDSAPPNPNGLLYKVAINRVLEPLTANECAAYAGWLAGGEIFQVYGSSAWFNQALSDAEAMRRVLGHDLESWTDEDARKISVIYRACRKLLQSSADAAHVLLANHEKIWRGIATPLRYAKSKYPGAWADTWFALYRPLVAEILEARPSIDEGLLAQAREAPGAEAPTREAPAAEAPAVEATAAVSRNETGLVGEWRGYYRCAGGNEVFMRLTFASAANPLDVRFELGPSLKSMHPIGVLSMTGSFDAASGQLTLEPQAWIQQPRGQVRPVGFKGRLDVRGDVIEGEVTGNPQCPDFSVTRREVMQKPVNSDGLLFKYLQRGMISATVADCRAYAEWLAAGDEITLGKSSFFSGLRSSDEMRAVLGKDLNQWGDDEARKMLLLTRHCKRLLEAEVDPEISELLATIVEKRLVWLPEPLGAPRNGNTLSHWLRAEQLVMVNEQQQALAAGKLAKANAMPPEIASIDNIDALGEEAGKGLRGPLAYLSKQELDEYYAGLRASRIKAAVATAGAMAEAWTVRRQTYSELEGVERDYQSLRKELESRRAPKGIDALDAAFHRESSKRADALWTGVLQTTLDELHALVDADLSRFRDLGDDQERQGYLARFHRPESGDRYFESHQSARTLYRETVERMVQRSEPQLLEWMHNLPPSTGANELLDRFSEDVFAVTPVPDRHAALQRAAADKKRSYNPDGYIRPDIVMSLRRGQWNEVGIIGLEDLAYTATSLREIKNACPRVVPEGSGPLTSFFWERSQEAVARIMRGEVQSKQEAQRAFMLFMNSLINQPGCRVDYFGTVVGCVSEQDHAAAQEYLLTSSEALSDMRILLRSGCGSEGAGGYVQGLVAHAGAGQYAPPLQVATDFWTWLAGRQ